MQTEAIMFTTQTVRQSTHSEYVGNDRIVNRANAARLFGPEHALVTIIISITLCYECERRSIGVPKGAVRTVL